MSQHDDCNTLDFTLLKVGIDKILGSIDKSASKQLTNLLGKNYLETNYCYQRPDVLCVLLKMIYGKSYVEMIKSI
jgi:hypothetical protein